MLISLTVHKSAEPITVRVTSIAKWLFFINLIPAIIAGAVIVLIFNRLELSQFSGISDWVVMSLMLSGITVQYVYYQQMTNTDYVRNPYGWFYSIVINVLFIIGYAVGFLKNPSSAGLMIIYPIVFLAFNVKVLRLIRHYEDSSIS